MLRLLFACDVEYTSSSKFPLCKKKQVEKRKRAKETHHDGNKEEKWSCISNFWLWYCSCLKSSGLLSTTREQTNYPCCFSADCRAGKETNLRKAGETGAEREELHQENAINLLLSPCPQRKKEERKNEKWTEIAKLEKMVRPRSVGCDKNPNDPDPCRKPGRAGKTENRVV